MLRTADISADYLIDFSVFIHPSLQSLFLSVPILHTLTPVSDFSDEQRETNIQLLLQVELGFPNGNGRHRYKLRLVKWGLWLLALQLELTRELLIMEMVVTDTSCAW